MKNLKSFLPHRHEFPLSHRWFWQERQTRKAAGSDSPAVKKKTTPKKGDPTVKDRQHRHTIMKEKEKKNGENERGSLSCPRGAIEPTACSTAATPTHRTACTSGSSSSSKCLHVVLDRHRSARQVERYWNQLHSGNKYLDPTCISDTIDRVHLCGDTEYPWEVAAVEPCVSYLHPKTMDSSSGWPPISLVDQQHVILNRIGTSLGETLVSLQLDLASDYDLFWQEPDLDVLRLASAADGGDHHHCPHNLVPCQDLASVLHMCPFLSTLVLNHVQFSAQSDHEVQALQEAISCHANLSHVELKWCQDWEHINSHLLISVRALEPLITALITTNCRNDLELTIMVSSLLDISTTLTHMARSTCLKHLKLGVEHRCPSSRTETLRHRSHHATYASLQQPLPEDPVELVFQQECHLLSQFLHDLQQQKHLESLDILAHHWQSSVTIQSMAELIQNNAVLQSISWTDYRLGTDSLNHWQTHLVPALAHNSTLKQLHLATHKQRPKRIMRLRHDENDSQLEVVNTTATTTSPTQVLESLADLVQRCNYSLTDLDLSHCGLNWSSSAAAPPVPVSPTVAGVPLHAPQSDDPITFPAHVDAASCGISPPPPSSAWGLASHTLQACLWWNSLGIRRTILLGPPLVTKEPTANDHDPTVLSWWNACSRGASQHDNLPLFWLLQQDPASFLASLQPLVDA